MEIRYKLYPYPVLAYYSDDYKNGSFESVVDLSLNGYHVQVDFTVALNNEDLKNLIAQGKSTICLPSRMPPDRISYC